jgi:type III restriction enzyme
MNLRAYYPDFVALANDGVHWLIETKGMEATDVVHKDNAARIWCRNATALTGLLWRYLKVPQKAYETLQPSKLEHLGALEPTATDLPFEVR